VATTQVPVYAKTSVNPASQLVNTPVAPIAKAKPAIDSTKNVINKANAPQYVATAKSSNTTITEPVKKGKPVDSAKTVIAKANTKQHCYGSCSYQKGQSCKSTSRRNI